MAGLLHFFIFWNWSAAASLITGKHDHITPLLLVFKALNELEPLVSCLFAPLSHSRPDLTKQVLFLKNTIYIFLEHAQMSIIIIHYKVNAHATWMLKLNILCTNHISSVILRCKLMSSSLPVLYNCINKLSNYLEINANKAMKLLSNCGWGAVWSPIDHLVFWCFPAAAYMQHPRYDGMILKPKLHGCNFIHVQMCVNG